jgi:hypothetical protein
VLVGDAILIVYQEVGVEDTALIMPVSAGDKIKKKSQFVPRLAILSLL